MSVSLSKPLRVALVLSLALNLFVVGAVAADAVMGRGWLAGAFGFRDRPPIVGMPNPRQLRAVLPDSDQAILQEALEAHRPEIRERLRSAFAARQTVAEAIAAEPFDLARLEAAFATLRDREADIAVAAQAMILDLVTRLDGEGRGKLAELLIARRKASERAREEEKRP